MKLKLKEITNEPSHNREKARHALFNYIRQSECKRLINRIMVAQNEQKFKSLVVLSQFPSEGKTLCISALAIGFLTLLDKRILILDTVSQSRDDSFYCHGVVESNAKNRNSGFIDIITTKTSDSLPVPTGRYGVLDPELDSPYDCADFSIKPFVDSVKQQYDLILLDTCALSEVNDDSFDPLILAQHSDAALLVTSSSSIQKDTFGYFAHEVKKHRINSLGVVFNAGAHYAA